MGNVCMEAEQVRFKDSTYHNLQTAVAAALEGGGGGGTTVVANPEGSATADLAKLQVGTTIYGIPAEAGDISYDNTSSGMTADDVQEAIDELNTGLGGVTELIPSGATSSNKLATASDIPGVATTIAPGIVQPDGTTVTINNGVISAAGGSGNANVYSTSETLIGEWLGSPLYRRCWELQSLPNTTTETIHTQLTNIVVKRCYGNMYNQGFCGDLPYVSASNVNANVSVYALYGSGTTDCEIKIVTGTDHSSNSAILVLEYIKTS